MQRLGFIHDMMDVKVLILYVMSRVNYPVTVQELYELCYQDECLSYFDVCTAVPEMVTSLHLSKLENDSYEITQKGKEAGVLTQDSIAFSVAASAVSASIRSMTASAWVRSSLPFRKARLVNSPRLAGFAPAMYRLSSPEARTAGLP